jgi:hypothetical protein
MAIDAVNGEPWSSRIETMKRLSLSVTVALQFIVIAPACAAANVGDHLKAQQGQPICFEHDDLLGYLSALAKHDVEKADSFWACTAMESSQEYVITEKDSEPLNAEMALAKVRVIGMSGSLDGWTVVGTGK